MPRKQKPIDGEEPKKSKKTLLNTMVKNVNTKNEHVILQLPLSQQQIDKIVNVNNTTNNISVPLPYEKNCCFINDDYNNVENNEVDHDIELIDSGDKSIETNNRCCFWCCHKVEYKVYGMPINYDSLCDTYTVYGSFCSLQCANAYNFSSHNGSDKVWEINSMIQMLGKRHGFIKYIRPAPARYLLKMFNGHLDIEEFRKMHHSGETSHVLNLPPMISIPSGYEVVNTSYIKKEFGIIKK